MSKRRALEPLEDAVDAPSPASKRARVEDEEMVDSAPAGTAHTNGTLLPAGSDGRVQSSNSGTDAEVREAEAGTGAADVDDEDESAVAVPRRQKAPEAGYTDLYLDTIDRKVLDFDFEKLCSITLSNINVYACLVCGKYFQGRGPKSQAYFHALDENHHVYINMETKKVYVLPDGYEVMSKSLDDIRFVVDPRLSKADVALLDKKPKVSWDLLNREYVPGFVGMNNIKANDYFNVVIQALSHVVPLRNYFMLEDLSKRPQLAQRFGTLVRKIWNPRAFKSHVSPHELLQEIALRSNKRFNLTDQSDPVEFLSWFLNNLHLAVGGSKTKPGSSIVQKVFQGTLKIESQEITARADAGDRLRFEDAAVKTEITKFLVLTLDLPPAPLFQDALEKNIIPQVPLVNILSKYDGIRPQEKMKNRVRYRLIHPLPPCLLFNIKRFSKNKFVSERNPTIVTFPITSLDMSAYVEPNPKEYPPGEPIWYDLVANVTHEAVKKKDDSVEGEQEMKVWKVQLKDRSRDEWYAIQDLYVEKERSETLFTKESYLQVWERRKGQPGGSGNVNGKGKAKA
ncbi:U4/U6.U5 tri-snRNP-associated protein 2 [Byssothecium circinans]|uniref:U4/U6.U5 tri-snRNP-associated protein 2 n=1 Tax=Byssothecium circinans TaxID=147558 RepID=A0A6A5TNI6_9PLEO|nr:U4/U6.U5 tri-snRNP-associated protein 2 [Byssothecium circinans]